MLDIDVSDADPDNTFKILIATDVHLGHKESDPIRVHDSFEAFEEVLQLANEHAVDFILLGGDLFDENKPSQYCFERTVDLLKKYSFGNKPISFQVMENLEHSAAYASSSAKTKRSIPKFNFHDPNLNVAIPIFSIHGNHDDPTGIQSISSMDTLSTIGLVNYLGRCDEIETVDITPVVLCKGETNVAIYGLGHLSDKRLARMFNEKKVTIHATPLENIFQLLVLHQNRAHRGNNNYLPTSLIPDMFDLVMWGHEHDCYIAPEPQNGVYYTQPGSTIATSLTEGEAKPKHCGILYVNQKSFHIEPLKLKSVRKLIYRQLQLESSEDLIAQGVQAADLSAVAEKKAVQALNSMLKQVEDERENDVDDNGKLPLLRLVIFYTDERQDFNAKQLLYIFDGQVANLMDMVLPKRIRASKNTRGVVDDSFLTDERDGEPVVPDLITYIKREFEEGLKDMQMFTTAGCVEAISRFLTFNDRRAMDDYMEYREKKFMEKLEEVIDHEDSEEQIQAKIKAIVAESSQTDETDDVRELLADPGREARAQADNDDVADAFNMDSDDEYVPKTTKAPAKRGGRGSRGGRGGRKSPTIKIESDDDMPSTTKTPAKRGGRGTRGPRGTRAKH